MTEAVIASYARTPIGKAYRGSLNATHGATLGAHAVAAAVTRAAVEPSEVQDVILGASIGEGTTGANIARQIALRAGLPVSTPGVTINRFCSSGLQTIALAAQRVMTGEVDILVAGGLESISLAQDEHMNTHMAEDPWLLEHKPEIFMTMLATSEVVAERYGIDRQRQDAFALRSQLRTASAQEAGAFDAEIVPISTQRRAVDRDTGQARVESVTLSADECNRPGTTAEALASLPPVIEGGTVTAGNSSQLSDGAAACVVMRGERGRAARDRAPGHIPAFVVAGCEPDEMGIGPVLAVPRLLERAGLEVDDIGLWELNEAFASQAVYCAETLGYPRTGSTSTAARSRSVTRTA